MQQILLDFQCVSISFEVNYGLFKLFLDTAQILTSAVIICTKAGLKTHALNFATQLIHPNLKQKINEKYKKKIETIVR